MRTIALALALTGGAMPDSRDPAAFIQALLAAGPAASVPPEARFYDPLIGSWDVEVTDHEPGGGARRSRGEWRFSWVLEGRAIQDVFIVPARPERPAPTGARDRYGTTVRVYDPGTGTWRLTWFDPVTGVENRLVARREGGEIVQTGDEPDGRRIRWVFSEVTADAFRWRGESSRDGEAWTLEAEFRGRRRAAAERRWSRRWEWTDRPGLEAVDVEVRAGGVRAEGTVVTTLDEARLRLRYRLEYDPAWRFVRGGLEVEGGSAPRRVEIERRGEEWRVDGAPRPDLAGCQDVDVMISPFTNTPPLRRMALAAGESRLLRAVYVRLPDLAVEPQEQEYTRLDPAEPPRRFRYRGLASGFVGELLVDAEGLVVEYGPWRAGHAAPLP